MNKVNQLLPAGKQKEDQKRGREGKGREGKGREGSRKGGTPSVPAVLVEALCNLHRTCTGYTGTEVVCQLVTRPNPTQ
jgi:hypothetical protein